MGLPGLKTLKNAAALLKISQQVGELQKMADQALDSKSLFLSKTFWLNIAGLAVTIGGILPPKYAAPVIFAGNIIMRFVTDQSVHIFPPDSNG